MNIPTPADPELLLARKVVARLYQGIRDHDYALWIMQGHKDTSLEVKSALAAIRATTEAAAAWHDEQYAMIPDEGRKSLSSHPAWAAALRANKHIKGSDDV